MHTVDRKNQLEGGNKVKKKGLIACKIYQEQPERELFYRFTPTIPPFFSISDKDQRRECAVMIVSFKSWGRKRGPLLHVLLHFLTPRLVKKTQGGNRNCFFFPLNDTTTEKKKNRKKKKRIAVWYFFTQRK